MEILSSMKAYLITTRLHRRVVKPLKNRFTMSSVKLHEIGDMLVNRFGIKYGDTIIVHTSYRHISHCDYEPEDIIHLLKSIVGAQGNIIMPSFRRSKEFYKQIPFNVKTTMGRSGLVNEILRSYPDTLRSVHPWKSCVVWGNDAAEIVRDHYKSERAFDVNSPYYKAYLLKGKYVGIGVDVKYCSFFHTVEDTNVDLFHEIYDEPIVQTIIDLDGCSLEMKYRHISKRAMSIQSVNRVTKYFKEPLFCETHIRSIPFSCVNLEYMYKMLVGLARKGISIHGIKTVDSSKTFKRSE